MSNILFVAYGGGHMSMLIPVMKWMLDNTPHSLSALPVTIAYPMFEQSGLEARGVKLIKYSDYLDDTNEEAYSFGRELLPDNHKPSLDIPEIESLAYLGLNMQELHQRYGKDKAETLFSKEGRQAFLPLNTLGKIVDDAKPDLIVTTNSPRSERAAIIVGRELGIPTISVMDLFGRSEQLQSDTHVFADRLCVLCQESKDNYQNIYGIDPETIIITGNPAFEFLHTLGKADREIWRRKYIPQWHNERVFLWGDHSAYFNYRTQKAIDRTQDDMYSDMMALYEACSQLGLKLVFRPHPSQTVEIYHEWMAANDVPEDQVAVIREGDAADAINACDYFGSIISTTLLHARILGKPILKLDYSYDEMDRPIKAKQWVIRSNDDIAATIKEMIADQHPGGDEFSCPANSSQRIGEQIINVLNNG